MIPDPATSTMASATRTVDIIDSSPIYMAGLAEILRQDGWDVAGERTSTAGGVCAEVDLIFLDPDAVRMDDVWSAAGPTEAVPGARSGQDEGRAAGGIGQGVGRVAAFLAMASEVAPTLLVTRSPVNGAAAELHTAGLAGFIDRHASASEVLRAAHEAMRPRRPVAHDAAPRGPVQGEPIPVDAVRGSVPHDPVRGQPVPHDVVVADGPHVPVGLSTRERQVIQHIARGLTHGQVARRLGISPHTVDTYVKRIRSKLRLGNKADLTRTAVLMSRDDRAVSRAS